MNEYVVIVDFNSKEDAETFMKLINEDLSKEVNRYNATTLFAIPYNGIFSRFAQICYKFNRFLKVILYYSEEK